MNLNPERMVPMVYFLFGRKKDEDFVKSRGVTLIEVVVALAILALLVGVIAPLIAQSIRAERERETIEQMKRIYTAIMGNPRLGDWGYLGEVGNLPGSLNDLVAKPPGVPAFAFYTNHVGYGWRGPYIELESDEIVDAWNGSFQYSTADGLPQGQIKSAGPDKAFGTSDDIVFPFLTAGEKVEKDVPVLITILVNDMANPAGIEVKLYYASNGRESMTPLMASTCDGSFFNNGFLFTTHSGIHALYVRYTTAQKNTNDNLFNINVFAGVQNHIFIRHEIDATVTPGNLQCT